MKITLKPILYALTMFVFLLGVVVLSCNKDTGTHSATITKCVTCANGGNCLNDTCRCPAGYEGASCQITSREKFIGSWTVFEKGTITSADQYSITIQQSFNMPTTINAIEISDLYNNFGIQVNAYVVADSIYIPLQQVSGKKIVGNGYIHSYPSLGTDGAITMRYMVTDIGTGSVDDFGYLSPTDSASLWIR